MQLTSQEQLTRYLSYLKQDEHNLNLLLEISGLYSDLGDEQQALHYLERASAVDYQSCLPHQGLFYIKQGQLDTAIGLFIKALDHDDTPASRYNLGFAYYLNNEFAQASEQLSVINDEEYVPAARLLMVRMKHYEGALEEAIQLLKTIPDYSTNSEALGLLALLHLDINHEDLARTLSEAALKLEPTNYDAQLVDIMLRLITQETNVAEIQDLLQRNQHDSRLNFALGSTYMMQGEFAQAITYFKNTLTIHPEFYDCHIAMAWCQLLTDDLHAAHETYQNAVALADELADGWGGLALIYALNNDLEPAEQLIHKAKMLDDECFLAQIAETIYLTHKNPEQAQQHLVDTLSNANTPVSEQLAVIMAELSSVAE